MEKHFYQSKLQIRYTMLEGEDADYAGAANYYRERLLKEGVLHNKDRESGDIRFYYDVLGGVAMTRYFLGVQYEDLYPMTTFKQAEEMSDDLLAGGISNQVMNYQGWMSGGISSASAEMAQATSGNGVSIQYYVQMFAALGLPDQIIEYIMGAVSRISDIINASGVQIIIFIAALQSIPGALYEVAKIEGATAYETFWKVTFPMVMPHIITNVVYTVVDSFADSDVVDLAYETAFTNNNYGLSSVMSLVSTLITCLILILVCRFIQKRTFYYN